MNKLAYFSQLPINLKTLIRLKSKVKHEQVSVKYNTVVQFFQPFKFKAKTTFTKRTLVAHVECMNSQSFVKTAYAAIRDPERVH